MHYEPSLNEEIKVRYFALVGHRAMSKGKLPLNDLAGGAGRMDVLIRGLMAGLLTSVSYTHLTLPTILRV